MTYKSFKGRWQVFGDKPVISILSTGLICLNKACYDQFVKPTNCNYVKLYYEPETTKMAFEFHPVKKGDFVLAISLIKTGFLAVIRAKTFLDYFGIKYQGQHRSYPVHYPIKNSQIKGIEIKLTEYMSNKP